jgi:hypothetical protein
MARRAASERPAGAVARARRRRLPVRGGEKTNALYCLRARSLSHVKAKVLGDKTKRPSHRPGSPRARSSQGLRAPFGRARKPLRGP